MSSHQKIISSGAEANIILVEGKEKEVIKDRIKKHYRLEIIDEKLRVQRTRQEIKLLEKASKVINTPLPIQSKERDKKSTKIHMPFIEGKKLSENLDKLEKKQALEICKKIGESISKIHQINIIHGDLTTSNIILDHENKVWFIDFGLGFHSERLEDKAVDLHLIKQALEAKHFTSWKEYWKAIETGYKKINKSHSKETLQRLKKVESRGRYKDKY